MNYDLPSVSDYGKATDTSERKLRAAITARDTAMEAVEASRRGTRPLSRDEYSDQKAIHGNAEADAHRFAHYLRSYGRFYHSVETEKWMRERWDMAVRRPSLALVWQHWRNVLAACEAQYGPEVTTDRWGGDKIVIITRAMIDAQLAVERAEDLYDRVVRAFDGRQPPTWQQMLDGPRVKPPKRPLPTSGKRKTSSPTRSTYIGA